MPLGTRHELRAQTAEAFRSGGAMRSDLLMTAIRSAARQEVLDTLPGLTEGHHETFDEVWHNNCPRRTRDETHQPHHHAQGTHR
jgi:hypothetical protein